MDRATYLVLEILVLLTANPSAGPREQPQHEFPIDDLEHLVPTNRLTTADTSKFRAVGRLKQFGPAVVPAHNEPQAPQTNRDVLTRSRSIIPSIPPRGCTNACNAHVN